MEHLSEGVCMEGRMEHLSEGVCMEGRMEHLSEGVCMEGRMEHLSEGVCMEGRMEHLSEGVCMEGRMEHLSEGVCMEGRMEHTPKGVTRGHASQEDETESHGRRRRGDLQSQEDGKGGGGVERMSPFLLPALSSVLWEFSVHNDWTFPRDELLIRSTTEATLVSQQNDQDWRTIRLGVRVS
ncbi:hypothetical protein BaRGS_00030241 [Batillaria attramentaria]|uniref:Uncharacterized protein n=1 Tax=Batillaria attramentaria TaxID=370345 RepID=A0ABD0JU15_9CAEN